MRSTNGGIGVRGAATLASVIAGLMMMAAPAAAQPAARVPAAPAAVAAAREAIAEGNRVWGRARVARDRATFERMLAPEFYVQFADRRVTREQFIEQISAGMPGLKLTRFDATVLTVQPTPDGGWSALIQEKLEMERADRDGQTVKVYSLWITRDGWKQRDGQWQLTSSEEIGTQMWRGGERPPFSDWE